MAKNNNLTDFLSNLADKFRAILGMQYINPQSFEDKIQEVYDAGFNAGGPTGITATTGDVLIGKVFGTGGNEKDTGTMPDLGTIQITTGVVVYDTGVSFSTPNGAYTGNEPSVRAGNAYVADAIGLTPERVLLGDRILGVDGTANGTLGAYFGGEMYNVRQYSGSTTERITSNSAFGCTINTSGTYQIVLMMKYSHWSNDGQSCIIYLNGTAILSSYSGSSTSGTATFNSTRKLVAGDVLTLQTIRPEGMWCVIAL